MRLTSTLRIAVLSSALALMFVFAVAAPAGARPKPAIKVSPSTLSVGDTATVTGRGFKPKSSFVLKVNNAKFAAGTTNKKGRLKLSFTIPDGAWQALDLNVTCAGKNASADLRVADGEPNLNGDDGINADSGDVQDDNPDDPGSSDQPPEFSF